MFLKNNLQKLAVILFLIATYPAIAQGYIYDYKKGISNSLIIGGGEGLSQGGFNERSPYIRNYWAGGMINVYVGMETQFGKYFSLISKFGADLGYLWAADFTIGPRVYLGIPYLFFQAGIGMSVGTFPYKVFYNSGSHHDGTYNVQYASVAAFFNTLVGVGLSIPFGKSVSGEIMFEGKGQWNQTASFFSALRAEIALNFSF